MVKIVTPTDVALQVVDYANGIGSYTTAVKVAALLGISDFSASTSPTLAEVSDLIRRAEDYIDEATNDSWRENLVENEYHDFKTEGSYLTSYKEYVGKIRLENEYVRKVIRLAVWEGDVYRDIASATSTVTLSDYSNVTSIVLTAGSLSWTLTAGTGNGNFNKTFGTRTTGQELCYLINEQPPTLTANFTNATASKALRDSTDAYNISKFFYANLEEDDTVTIVSLLPGSDGASCTITTSGSGISATSFTSREDYDRNGDWWDMRDTSDIFFRAEFPIHSKHAVKATYTYGNPSIPAIIEEAATKLVCCEMIASDDSYVLLDAGGSQAGLDLKSKYDSYKADVDKIIKLKKRITYYLDGM
jgi:hypothetical protein